MHGAGRGSRYSLRLVARGGCAPTPLSGVSRRPFDSHPFQSKNKQPLSGLSVFGAGRGSRTPISTLARWHNSRYTIPAQSLESCGPNISRGRVIVQVRPFSSTSVLLRYDEVVYILLKWLQLCPRLQMVSR